MWENYSFTNWMTLRKRKNSRDSLNVAPIKRVKTEPSNTININHLPEEIILHIFSFLTQEDLYYRARLVCKKWQRTAMLSSTWQDLSVANIIPTNILKNWIRLSSPVIKAISLTCRTDTNEIIEFISRHLPRLTTIRIYGCWGTAKKMRLKDRSICHMLRRCQHLNVVTLEKVRVKWTPKLIELQNLFVKLYAYRSGTWCILVTWVKYFNNI